MGGAIAWAETEAEAEACFEVVHELRPELTLPEFLRRVALQRAEGYRLVRLDDSGVVRAIAGYRLLHNLAWGRFLYVDDLVTRSVDHSMGYGRELFGWLIAQAKAEGCARLELDSGVQRFGAHRFYLGQRMDITCHHFGLRVGAN